MLSLIFVTKMMRNISILNLVSLKDNLLMEVKDSVYPFDTKDDTYLF
jgi:hypothetical protein